MRVVCFDLGGVLVRITLDLVQAAERAGVGPVGAQGSFLDFGPFIDFQAGRVSEDAYLVALAAHLGVSSDEALRTHNHILVEPYAATHDLVDELANQGILCACLSNTNAPHWHEMRATDRFPNVRDLKLGVASHEHELEKPDPRFFRRFEELASRELDSLLRPDEIVFFDDTRPNVEAAQARGWRAFWIDPSANTADQMKRFLVSL
jgi:HAD superfamily hydrolase (TIGR01509 family)